MKLKGFWLLFTVIVSSFFGGAFSSYLLTGSTLYAQPPKIPKIVEAEEFRLVDKDGSVVAKMGKRGDGGAVILFSKNGKPSVGLFSGSDNLRGLAVFDNGGKMRVILNVSSIDDTVGLSFTDRNEVPRVVLQNRTDKSLLSFSAKNKKPQLKLVTADTGSGVALINPDTANVQIGLFRAEDSSGGVTLYDNAGIVRGVIAVDKDGFPFQQFSDKNGKAFWSTMD
ncbi:MAG: hypothetical protein JXR79_02235 [Nitrospirae bacterium]|nr:hypothetical protein [Nitrospirota bacterium]